MRNLLSSVLLFTVSIGALPYAANADLIANWGFEVVTPPDATDTASVGPFSPDAGAGSASGVHALAATDWTTPVGNGSDNSLSANTWSTGDYFQFSVATTGYENILLSFDQTRSGTGPATFDLTYSVNGGGFVTALDDYTVQPNTNPPNIVWSVGAGRQATYLVSSDLSAVTAVDNVASLVIRLVSQVTTAAAGTNRVDNFLVEGTPIAVPEPGAFLFGGLVCGVIGLVVGGRRLVAKLWKRD